MDHYINIDVQPDQEFSAHQLMSALYAKLHRALVAQKSTRIGVSFPDFRLKPPQLGMRLRLHGTLADLSAFMTSDWMASMRDLVTLTPLTCVPETANHCVVRRMQFKSSPERLRRRLMRRHNFDEQEALKCIPDEIARLSSLPFVQLRSTSTGQSFRLFIEHVSVPSNSMTGDFNTYGLSRGGAIPWF